MAFVEDDHVVQALPPDGPDDPFDEGVLPRRARRGQHLLDAHDLDPTADYRPIHAVAIPDHVSWRCIPRECFRDLLRYPCRGRVRRHAKVHDPPTLVVEQDEHEEKAKAGGGQNEEIDGCKALRMVPQERPPRLRWRPRVPDHVFGDSGLTDLDPKLEKFAVDARCAPQRVFPRYAPDQCPDLPRDWRAASSPWT